MTLPELNFEVSKNFRVLRLAQLLVSLGTLLLHWRGGADVSVMLRNMHSAIQRDVWNLINNAPIFPSFVSCRSGSEVKRSEVK